MSSMSFAITVGTFYNSSVRRQVLPLHANFHRAQSLVAALCSGVICAVHFVVALCFHVQGHVRTLPVERGGGGPWGGGGVDTAACTDLIVQQVAVRHQFKSVCQS